MHTAQVTSPQQNQFTNQRTGSLIPIQQSNQLELYQQSSQEELTNTIQEIHSEKQLLKNQESRRSSFQEKNINLQEKFEQLSTIHVQQKSKLQAQSWSEKEQYLQQQQEKDQKLTELCSQINQVHQEKWELEFNHNRIQKIQMAKLAALDAYYINQRLDIERDIDNNNHLIYGMNYSSRQSRDKLDRLEMRKHTLEDERHCWIEHYAPANQSRQGAQPQIQHQPSFSTNVVFANVTNNGPSVNGFVQNVAGALSQCVHSGIEKLRISHQSLPPSLDFVDARP